ncbi:uncharacterized protein LOC120413528 [Culex pipiens pallens]|uniref:uncharacterized protein LOC120413528 n=1 Tax=Culex pipiens pallens TaxID=42434 RepID=UPI001954C268|nr:uncharacterized protein LOC120413528 [Culex pipiens pallens]
MNTSLVVLLVILCHVVECIEEQSNIANLVDEIITQLTRSEAGSHDVVFAGLEDPILEGAFRSLSSRSEVTFQLLQNGHEAGSSSRKKISLLLVDCASFINLQVFSALMKNIAKSGLWQPKTKVVVFMRNDRSSLMKIFGNILARFGTKSVKFVEYNDHFIHCYSMKMCNTAIESVNNTTYDVFEQNFVNVNQYLFKIHLNPSIPFHHYVSESKAKGIDVEIIEMIIKHLNGSVRYYKKLGDINDEKRPIDMSLQYFREVLKVDTVFLPNHEHLCITVPKVHERMMFLQLFRPFTAEVWMFAVAVACYHLVLKHRILKSVKIFNSIKEHIKFFSIANEIFNFILVEAYLAKVITFLATMQYEPNPRSIADLNRLKQAFIVNKQEASLLINYPNLKLLHNSNRSPDYLEKYSTVVYCKIAEYFFHSDANFNQETNDAKVFILEERPASVMNFYTFPRFSPFTAMFQEYINRIADTGTWSKIYNQWSTSPDQFETFFETSERVIKFDDMVSFWVVTIVAYLSCIFVLLCEVFLIKYWKMINIFMRQRIVRMK